MNQDAFPLTGLDCKRMVLVGKPILLLTRNFADIKGGTSGRCANLCGMLLPMRRERFLADLLSAFSDFFCFFPLSF